MTRSLHYVINASMPHKKAYGIQSTQTCQSFIEAGFSVTMVCPHTNGNTQTLRAFYGLRTDINVARVPAIDNYRSGRTWFLFSTLTFMVSSFLYLLWQKLRGNLDVVYVIDMDTFSFSFLPLLGTRIIAEIHGTKPNNFLTRFFFKHIHGVVTVNPGVRDHLIRSFHIEPDRVIVEPCGVDDVWLNMTLSKSDVRKQLHVPDDVAVAAFVGRFYPWKGLQILPEAALLMPEVRLYVVGGTKEEFARVTHTTDLPENMYFPGEAKNSDVPQWLSAADVLVVPWPKHQDQFHRYLSPMKIYEYMALRRPVVGADESTITDGIPDGEALLYEPDNAASLAEKVRGAIAGGPSIDSMVEKAYMLACRHSLSVRGERIIALMR